MEGTEVKRFEGTADVVGTNIFIEIVMPIIHASSQQMPPDQLALLYGGFMSAAMGSLAADFGQANANILLEQFVGAMLKQPPLDAGGLH